jgi:hypothetical protein
MIQLRRFSGRTAKFANKINILDKTFREKEQGIQIAEQRNVITLSGTLNRRTGISKTEPLWINIKAFLASNVGGLAGLRLRPRPAIGGVVCIFGPGNTERIRGNNAQSFWIEAGASRSGSSKCAFRELRTGSKTQIQRFFTI